MKNSNFSTREMGRIAIFAALTAILAFVVIPLPFSPVPVSGQTLGVMLAGLYLSGRNAFFSQLIYTFLGVIGLPVFAGGSSGIGVLFGPSGGFIWGFLLGAYIIGKLTEDESNKSWIINTGILVTGGVVAIYFPGLIQFSLLMGVSIIEAFSMVVFPFLPGDILKIIVSLFMYKKI
ncbi:MAG: biotin transporter BioY [Bacillota bacterium]